MPLCLKNLLLLQLPLGLLSKLPALMLLSLAFFTPIRVMDAAKLPMVNFILMTLVALLTPMFALHY